YGVCHFDIHPSNILIDDKGVPRLLDFGMSFLTKNINNNTLDSRWKVLDFNENYNEDILNLEPPEVTVINALRHNYSLNNSIDLVCSNKPIFKD
ncbi:hypothetical protein OE165_26895, partial [Escherichia coli]|uniref:hypothetical protein n=1 Tax=Escherichia coli TaxID=562 RepID=UPI0021F31F3E